MQDFRHMVAGDAQKDLEFLHIAGVGWDNIRQSLPYSEAKLVHLQY